MGQFHVMSRGNTCIHTGCITVGIHYTGCTPLKSFISKVLPLFTYENVLPDDIVGSYFCVLLRNNVCYVGQEDWKVQLRRNNSWQGPVIIIKLKNRVNLTALSSVFTQLLYRLGLGIRSRFTISADIQAKKEWRQGVVRSYPR